MGAKTAVNLDGSIFTEMWFQSPAKQAQQQRREKFFGPDLFLQTVFVWILFRYN